MTAASLHINHRRPSRPGAPRAPGRRALVALAGMLVFAAQVAWPQAASRLERDRAAAAARRAGRSDSCTSTGPRRTPVTFTIDNPARIAVDLPGTTLALESRRVDVKTGGVDTIVAAEASGRTRLVFNLDRMQPYRSAPTATRSM